MVSYNYLNKAGLEYLWSQLKTKLPGKATTSSLGLVKPDGTTTTVDSDGTIHASGSGGSEYTAGVGIEISDENEISGVNYGIGGPRSAVNLSQTSVPNLVATSGEDFVKKIKTGKVVQAETNDGIKNLKNQLGISDLFYVDIQTGSSDNIGTWFYLTNYKYYVLNGNGIYYSDLSPSLFSYLHRLEYFNSSSLSAITLGGVIDELATTRLADTLNSQDTAPTANNTITWVYK